MPVTLGCYVATERSRLDVALQQAVNSVRTSKIHILRQGPCSWIWANN